MPTVHVVFCDGTYITFQGDYIVRNEVAANIWRKRWYWKDELFFTILLPRWVSFDVPPKHLIVT